WGAPHSEFPQFPLFPLPLLPLLPRCTPEAKRSPDELALLALVRYPPSPSCPTTSLARIRGKFLDGTMERHASTCRVAALAIGPCSRQGDREDRALAGCALDV